MSTETITRRSALTTVAALAMVPAVPVTALAMAADQPDAELRRLWTEYLAYVPLEDAARVRVQAVRAAYDAEASARYPGENYVSAFHHKELQPLWQSHGLDQLYDDWNEADERVREIIAAIRGTPAEGPIGIGIKLAALPTDYEACDLEDGFDAALGDIARLTGVDLAADIEAMAGTGS